MHHDLLHLLSILRNTTGLEWLADEVKATIEEAKQLLHTDPQFHLFPTRSTSGMSDQEELELAIETVYDRLVQPCWMWRDAERTFKMRAETQLDIAQDQSQSNERVAG